MDPNFEAQLKVYAEEYVKCTEEYLAATEGTELPAPEYAKAVMGARLKREATAALIADFLTRAFDLK